jgi:hypothetical protein
MPSLDIAKGFVVAMVLMVVLFTVTALTTSSTLLSTGLVKALGVSIYSDSACTQLLTSISWGTADPGVTINKTIYIKNTSDVAVTLSLKTANWNPSNASSYISLKWNYGGQTLSVNQVVTTTLSLSVASNIQGITSYSFNIIITGTG